MMFVSINNDTTSATDGAGSDCFPGSPYSSLWVFSKVRVAQSLVFCVVFWGLNISNIRVTCVPLVMIDVRNFISEIEKCSISS